MKTFLTVVQELWGLFVDDGTLAVVIILWLILVAVVLPHTGIPVQFNGAILLAGLILGLMENIWRASRKK
jgi:hypothetical protein